MDSESAGAGNQLLYVDIHIDENEPCRGILDLLSILRPQWKAEDIQLKASKCVCKEFVNDYYFISEKNLSIWIYID